MIKKLLYSMMLIAGIMGCENEEGTVDNGPSNDLSLTEANVVVDGEAVFFQGFYTNDRTMITNPTVDTELQLLKDAGYNLVYQKLGVDAAGDPVVEDLAFLDKCQSLGIKVLVDYFGNTTIVDVAAAYKDHAAIWAYNLQDDANAHATPEEVLANQREIERIVPNKTTIVSVYQNYEGGQSQPPVNYSRTADVVGFQTYPVGHWALDYVPQPFTIDETLKSVDNDLSKFQRGNQSLRPMIPNPQVFPWVSTSQGKIKEAPTAAEFKCITYIGIINGAKSIINYSLHEPPVDVNGEMFEWKAWEDAELWAACKQVNGEINQIQDILMHGKRAEIYQDNEWITAAYWNYEGKYYLIITNMSLKQDEEFSFKFPTTGTLHNMLEPEAEDNIAFNEYEIVGSLPATTAKVFEVK